MPYVNQAERERLEAKPALPAVTGAGSLNYLLTRVITRFLKDNPNDYQTYNDIVGALEGAKLEVYRRLIAPYEDKKRKENGDVY